MAETIIQQGSFRVTTVGTHAASTIYPVTIPCRVDPDWVEVYNYTQFGTTDQYAGVKYYWQKGMTSGAALAEYHGAASSVTNAYLMTSGGIYVVDTSATSPLSTNIIDTGTSNSTTPTVTTSVTTGLFGSSATTMGAIVRFSNATGVLPSNLCGFDYEIGTLTSGVSFVLRYAAATAFAVSTGATGKYTVLPYDPIYYPRNRYILNIQGAATTGTTNTIRVTTSVSHGYTVGQEIRLKVPSVFGPKELNDVIGTVTAAPTMGTFDLDVVSNTLSTAFVFPAATLVPFTFAQAIPVGEDTAAALTAGVNILGDATYNQAAINIVLGTGMGATVISGPAGFNGHATTGDVIYWKAGKSFSA